MPNKRQVTDYNKQAHIWSRNQPMHQSDFVGRPEVFEIVKNIPNIESKIVLDMGCGEGYFSEMISPYAGKVVGIDLHEKMIEHAKKREKERPSGVEYLVGDIRNMTSLFEPDSFDVAVGVYVTNYLHPDELQTFYHELNMVLNLDDAKFVLLLPHPWKQFDEKFDSIQYDTDSFDYIKDRGKFFPAKLKRIDGKTVEVGAYHSTLEDHFKAINRAGLSIRNMHEPVFTPELTKKYPLFKDLENKAVCLIMEGE